MAADGHLGYTKMTINFITDLLIGVMFDSGVGFPAELRLLPRDLHTRIAVARNPCVRWAFLFYYSQEV